MSGEIFSGNFTQQEPLPEAAIAAALRVMQSGRLHRYNTAPGETCWKLEHKWFWKEGTRAGSAKGVMGHMAMAHGRNSNFLLNVGPDRNGRIIESSRKVLAEIGKLRAAPQPK